MNDKLKKHIKKLMSDSSYRRESGQFAAEGIKIALETPLDEIECVFASESFICSGDALKCRKVLESEHLTVISDEEMKKISDTVTPQGIIVISRMKTYKDAGAFLDEELKYRKRQLISEPFILILEAIQDPGNLGTILRSAEAGGVTALAADTLCADLYSPKTVRSTMGSIFRIPFMRFDDVGSFAIGLREKSGAMILAASPYAECDYTFASYLGPTAVMIGNESRGLSERLISISDKSISIPMTGDTQSLNASAAASVIIYEAFRQRRLQNGKNSPALI